MRQAYGYWQDQPDSCLLRGESPIEGETSHSTTPTTSYMTGELSPADNQRPSNPSFIFPFAVREEILAREQKSRTKQKRGAVRPRVDPRNAVRRTGPRARCLAQRSARALKQRGRDRLIRGPSESPATLSSCLFLTLQIFSSTLLFSPMASGAFAG